MNLLVLVASGWFVLVDDVDDDDDDDDGEVHDQVHELGWSACALPL